MPTLFKRDRVPVWIVPTAVACVLLGLAFLQYRWSTQVSEAEDTRLRVELNESMLYFRQDLSRAFTKLCTDVQTVGSGSSPDLASVPAKFRLRQKTGPLPDFAENIYLWTASDGSSEMPSGYRNADWPPELGRLKKLLSVPRRASAPQLFATGEAAHGVAGTPAAAAPVEIRAPRSSGIDQSIPALVCPASPFSGTGWIIVKIDMQAVEQRLFPQLASRYFGDTSSADYWMSVATRSPQGVQTLPSARSDPLPHPAGDYDAILHLFGPPEPVERPPHSYEGVNYFHPYERIPNGPAPGLSGIRFDPIHYSPDETDWVILVKARNGSLASVVAGSRRRNLAMSFGVLGILASSVALIIFNAHQARRLAFLQLEFVAGVSHELRTPVAAILSMSDNIAAGVTGDAKKFALYGELIRDHARRLSHLVEQVLRFSTTKRNDLALRAVQVSDVIDEALESTANLIATAGVEVHCHIEPDLPAVFADSSELSQCLENLITNAVKYGGNAKWLSVRAGTTSDKPPFPHLWITVEDRGIGLDREELGHIFDQFYRSPRVMEAQIQGTGLGLALAKRFAESMNGWITVESELHLGTAFTVHLPFDRRSTSTLGRPVVI